MYSNVSTEFCNTKTPQYAKSVKKKAQKKPSTICFIFMIYFNILKKIYQTEPTVQRFTGV